MVFVIVLLCILAVVFVLALLPIDLLLTFLSDDGFSFRVRVLFWVFGEKSKNPVVKKVRQTSGISTLKKVKDLSSGVTVTDVLELVSIVVHRLAHVFFHCKIIKFKFHIVSGGVNAATDYGTACACVYPAIAVLKNKYRIKNEDVNLSCDYSYDKTKVDVECFVRFHLGAILMALFCAFIDKLKSR